LLPSSSLHTNHMKKSKASVSVRHTAGFGRRSEFLEARVFCCACA
jgi:hypothetical protein